MLVEKLWLKADWKDGEEIAEDNSTGVESTAIFDEKFTAEGNPQIVVSNGVKLIWVMLLHCAPTSEKEWRQYNINKNLSFPKDGNTILFVKRFTIFEPI